MYYKNIKNVLDNALRTEFPNSRIPISYDVQTLIGPCSKTGMGFKIFLMYYKNIKNVLDNAQRTEFEAWHAFERQGRVELISVEQSKPAPPSNHMWEMHFRTR